MKQTIQAIFGIQLKPNTTKKEKAALIVFATMATITLTLTTSTMPPLAIIPATAAYIAYKYIHKHKTIV